MFEYTIVFKSQCLDENGLRQILSERLGVDGASVSRRLVGASSNLVLPAEPKHDQLSNDIIAFLHTNRKARLSEIHAQFSKYSYATLQKRLQELTSRRFVQKISHGVYASQDIEKEELNSPLPAKESDRATAKTSVVQILTDGPMTAVELREALSVSRQRVEQLLSKLMKSGQVERFEVTGERGQYVYKLSSQPQSVLGKRAPSLRGNRSRVISAMVPDAVHLASTIATHLECSTTEVKKHINELSNKGLCYKLVIRSRMYCGLTPEGVLNSSYESGGTKGEPADICDDFGPVRVSYLKALAALGASKTFDLTCAVGDVIPEERNLGSGQVIQRLRRDGLVEISAGNADGHPSYTLTKTGQYLVAIIHRLSGSLDVEDVSRKVADGKRKHSEVLAAARYGTQGEIHRFLSPAYASIVNVLREGHPLYTSEILERMEPKFANPRSIHLAMRTLEDRGFVVRTGQRTKMGMFQWALEGTIASNA